MFLDADAPSFRLMINRLQYLVIQSNCWGSGVQQSMATISSCFGQSAALLVMLVMDCFSMSHLAPAVINTMFIYYSLSPLRLHTLLRSIPPTTPLPPPLASP